MDNKFLMWACSMAIVVLSLAIVGLNVWQLSFSRQEFVQLAKNNSSALRMIPVPQSAADREPSNNMGTIVQMDKSEQRFVNFKEPLVLGEGEKVWYLSTQPHIASILPEDAIGDAKFYGKGPLRGGQIKALNIGTATVCAEVRSKGMELVSKQCITVVVRPKADTQVSAFFFAKKSRPTIGRPVSHYVGSKFCLTRPSFAVRSFKRCTETGVRGSSSGTQ